MPNRVQLYIAVSHDERRTPNGLAPVAYAMCASSGGGHVVYWGFGGEKTAETMFAHAIIRISEENLCDPEQDEIEIVAEKTGFQLYPRSHVWKWQREPKKKSKKSGKHMDTWLEASVLFYSLGIQVREPHANEKALLGRIHGIAAEMSKLANETGRFKSQGIAETGCSHLENA